METFITNSVRARKVIDNEKYNAYNSFQENTKIKPFRENSNTEQNKSTNITSGDSSDDSYTIIEDTPLEKHEGDNRHIDMSLIEESLGFSAFRHYAVQTRLKQSVDQSDFKKKTLNDWNIMSLTTKQLFVNQTPLKNQNQELCLCRKTYVTTETSPMVACDLCKKWYHNNCIGLESAFTHTIPFFICGQCINRHYSGFTPFLRLSINDFYNGKAKTMELIFNNYLSLSDEAKFRLQYQKFLSPHRENCNTKSISSLNILTNKGISNQYLNCHISASVYLLLRTIICAMLPSLLENDSVLNNNLHYVKNKLHSEASSTHSFTQCDRKSPFPKVPVLGQILEEVMQKTI